jgi:PAS domain-containing protein
VHAVTLHLIDVRERFGVFLGLLLDTRSAPGNGLSCSPMFRPRVTTMRKNELAMILEVDVAATLILGWSADELLGCRTIEFAHPDDRARAIANRMNTLRSPGVTRRIRLRFRRRDERYVWFELTQS